MAIATSSATVLAGKDGVTTSSSGTVTSSEIGAKSSGVLNGILAKSDGFTAWAKAPIRSVWPSGAALATVSSPIMPPAPGRFSTTTVSPSASCSLGAMKRAVVSAPPPGEYGTTSRMGLLGNVWARARPATTPETMPAPAPSMTARRFSDFIRIDLPVQWNLHAVTSRFASIEETGSSGNLANISR